MRAPLLGSPSTSMVAEEQRYDVTVIGGTPAGIGAAIAAAREGATVLLVEPTQHLGGLMTGGLGATDIEPLMTIGGLFRRLVLLIRDHYEREFGADSDDFRLCLEG